MAGVCSLTGCGRRLKAHGYCDTHWKRVLRTGDAGSGQIGRDRAERFMDLVDASQPGCWPWAGRRQPSGYGQFWVDEVRRADPAHRVSYELFVGPIPVGLHIDHLCRNRACVRPTHLEAVTPAENFDRSENLAAVRKRTGRCERGHDLATHGRTTAEGIYTIVRCQECRRIRERTAA